MEEGREKFSLLINEVAKIQDSISEFCPDIEKFNYKIEVSKIIQR